MGFKKRKYVTHTVEFLQIVHPNEGYTNTLRIAGRIPGTAKKGDATRDQAVRYERTCRVIIERIIV